MTLYSSIAICRPIISSDWFYNPNENWWKEQQKLGTLAVEMETHILYALQINLIKTHYLFARLLDHFEKDKIYYVNMTSKQRETGLSKNDEKYLIVYYVIIHPARN